MVGRAVGVVAVVIAAVLLLTGCVAAPPDPPAAGACSDADALAVGRRPRPRRRRPRSPHPEPVDTVVAHITVRPEHLDLVNGAGIVVGELSYDADADTFVDTISTVLGGPPDVEERPGGHEWHAWTSYTWPGLVVSDDHEPSEYPSDMNVARPVHAPDRRQRHHRFDDPGIPAGRRPAGIRRGARRGVARGRSARRSRPRPGRRSANAATTSGTTPTGSTRTPTRSTSSQVYVPQPGVTSVVSAPWNFGIGHV